MKKIKLNISDKEYIVQIAETEEQQEKGLKNIKELPENEGMLFIVEDSDDIGIWMKDTLIPLDIVFIDEDMVVKSVKKGEPKSEEILKEKNIPYILEVNQDSGIQVGDEVDFKSNYKVKESSMLVLNTDGTPQMELEGGERIFSRANTKTLIKFAKKAAVTQKDNDYVALGKRVFKFIKAQDENEPEFVELKK